MKSLPVNPDLLRMTNVCRYLTIAAVAVSALCQAALAGEGRIISNPVSPEVRMSSRNGVASFTVEALPGTKPSGRMIATRSKTAKFRFDEFPAQVDLSERALGEGPLRLWMRVEWRDSQGKIRQGETLFSPALGAEAPPSAGAMRIFDLKGLEQSLADESLRIRIPFEMAADGKATVIIEDAKGGRIRNLVAGKTFLKGRNEVAWDGRREDGAQAAPGDYAVRIVTHPGLSYRVLFRFGNGGEKLWTPYGPTHTCFRSICSNGEKIQASANFTEGGRSTVVMDLNGRALHGWSEIWTLGNQALFHVSGSNQFYSVREKRQKEKGADGTETERSTLQVFAYNWNDANRRGIAVRDMPGSNTGFRDADAAALGERAALTGAVKVGDKVYVGDRLQGGVKVYRLIEREDTTEFSPTDEQYALDDAGCLAMDENGVVYILDGTTVKTLSPNSPDVLQEIAKLPLEPSYVAVRKGMLYALHDGEHQIFVYDLKGGRLVRKLGEPGGSYAGAWRKMRLVNPLSLFFAPDGLLWVTENRQSPKRLTRWDVDKGEVVYEKLGSESYGAPGCGMDPADPNHWLAQDAEWRIDPATGREEVVGSLFIDTREGDGRWNAPPNHNRFYKFERRAGRTFVIGVGQATTVYELKDHRLVPLALVSTPGIYSYQLGRSRTCEPLVEAYNRAFADVLANPKKRYPDAKGNESALMLWVDQNGNELLDADEIEFAPADTDCAVGYWGYALGGLDFSLQVTTPAGMKILSFSPLGWTDKGAPRYSLKDAWEKAAAVADDLPVGTVPPRHGNGFADRWGRSIVVGSEPFMLAFDARGRLNWHFKNPFPGVHGSQKAPLPVPGELQGVLFSMGVAPFNDKADVTAIMNNHGRVFFMTTDGILLDELFNDCRVASTADESLIGGEAFGGSFQKDEANNRYILQAGGGGARVYAIEGLDQVREQRVALAVSAAMLEAGARLNPVLRQEDRGASELRIPRSSKTRQDWRLPRLASWKSGSWAVDLDGEYDDRNLYLSYTVHEPSPWVNKGVDPFLMFKTGDCVDFQLATKPFKPGTRKAGDIGDIRLLVSPGATAPGTNNVVLYRHRIPADEKAAARPMDFNSPIRKYQVDDVKTLDVNTASVTVESSRYAVRLTVPFKDLGLDGQSVADQTFRGDFGVVFGDRDGQINLSRVYWANKETGLVSDVPGEMMPEPDQWGTILFDDK